MGGERVAVRGVYSLGASDIEWTVFGPGYSRLVIVIRLNGTPVGAHMFTPNAQNWTPTTTTLGDSVMSISLSTFVPTPSQLGSLLINNWSVNTKLDGQLVLSNVAVLSWDQQGVLISDLLAGGARTGSELPAN
jgi:hypothetical protein